MAPKLKKKQTLNEADLSTWNPRLRPFFSPDGTLGRWFAAWMSKAAHPYLSSQEEREKTTKLSGDTIQLFQTIKNVQPALGTIGSSNTPILPQIEYDRRRRYKEFEVMDEYPEVGAAFDTYSDDSTQKDSRNRRWIVNSSDPIAIEIVEKLFDSINLDKLYWDIIRNMVKFGDCFVETIIDVNRPIIGIQRLKILNPNFILRVENEFGYLIGFLQEIPKMNDYNLQIQSDFMGKSAEVISLDKNQMVHFRLYTSDPNFYPYGKSVAAMGIEIFRSLRLMEDAMLIYRISRAPERRIFYVDVGNLPATKAEMFIEKLKDKFKKERFYNTQTGNIDGRYNPLGVDEDFFVPVRGNRGTKIDTLAGAQNLGEIDDVKYFRDKLLAAMKIPKDYIVEKDKSPERKANLSQLDVKFARVIVRVQHCAETGFTQIAKRHLQLKGFPQDIISTLRVELPSPSDMFEKRRMELDLQRLEVAQAAKTSMLFPDEYIYKEYFDLTDYEIETIREKLKEEQKEQEAAQAALMPQEMPGAPMEEEAEATYPENEEEEDNHFEPKENKSANEEIEFYLKNKVEDGKWNENLTLIENSIKRKSKKSKK